MPRRADRTHYHTKAPQPRAFRLYSAEGVGFEPTVDETAHNGFRDRPVQPLRHPSEGPVTGEGGRVAA
jgi:hypothetical protein